MTETPNLMGRTVGHYRIVAAIGAGGMGVVYRHGTKITPCRGVEMPSLR